MRTQDVFGGQFEPSNPFIASNEGGGDGGGGGNGGGGAPPPAKTFTQEEVARIAAKEKSEGERAARAKLESELRAKYDTDLAERDKRIQELELKGKTEDERREIERRQRSEADEKARKAREAELLKERDDARAEGLSYRNRWLDDRKAVQVGSALVSAKVVASAADDARAVFSQVSKIETDDDGNVTSVIYGGQTYTKLAEAAAAFLRDRPFFASASAPGGGSGMRQGGSGGNGSQRQLDEMTEDELLALDAQTRTQAR